MFLSYTGVHCTHGYNRTGFLIISYLVEIEDWRYNFVQGCLQLNILFIFIIIVLKLRSLLSAMFVLIFLFSFLGKILCVYSTSQDLLGFTNQLISMNWQTG